MTEETIETQESQVAEQVVEQSTLSNVNVADFIAESKKYRQRAQNAEKKLDQLQKQMDVDRQKKMEDNEQFKELAEDLKKQLESKDQEIADLQPIIERANALETSTREKLLSDFPENEREDYADLPTPVLQKVHDKLINNKPAKTDSSLAGFSSVQSKPFTDMNRDDQRKNWKNVLAGYTKR
ncbi:MAG: hypothetical protein Unbinned400contig1004_23 [Prokaryotic dsDNA virus sp.]|nr:MAG: hypothetical protein Unbinned400contig1004_23 [Prokaryotic dsDNA virus sp.]|tara:strand:- start:19405 stop:19950 length:546 start_codon:yes stop_codon:yes gene_type:complete